MLVSNLLMVAHAQFILISCESEKCKFKFLLDLDLDLARKMRKQQYDEMKKASALEAVSSMLPSNRISCFFGIKYNQLNMNEC